MRELRERYRARTHSWHLERRTPSCSPRRTQDDTALTCPDYRPPGHQPRRSQGRRHRRPPQPRRRLRYNARDAPPHPRHRPHRAGARRVSVGHDLQADGDRRLADHALWIVATNPTPDASQLAQHDRLRGTAAGYLPAATLRPLALNLAAAVSWGAGPHPARRSTPRPEREPTVAQGGQHRSVPPRRAGRRLGRGPGPGPRPHHPPRPAHQCPSWRADQKPPARPRPPRVLELLPMRPPRQLALRGPLDPTPADQCRRR
jgi:hypothetical protein